ncbi:unnamed protein product [Durusdinium trenchii]|uniref:Uncharacterized protein n=1 Tax=Durusdinium trenchii TaxID=1381693 RepID=A0ABP0H887_9DINO
MARRQQGWWLAVAAAVCTLAVPCRLSVTSVQGSEPTDNEQAEMGAMDQLLGSVEASLQPLREEVASGHIIPKFGERAQSVVSSAVQKAGSAGAEVENVVDAMLQELFLQQLVLLRQQTAAKFGKASRPVEAVTQADQQFVTQAEELKRPGSTWSYEVDRYALRAVLEGSFRREAAYADEHRIAARSQQSTVEIISRLQGQMENLQMRLQHMRAGQPWFISSSYRIPGTPLTMIGRFQQGRASIELNLAADRDPVTAEAGFVRGVGPANLGVSANFGF